MNKLRGITATLIALVMVFSLAGCKLLSKTELGEYNTVVAKVNGTKLVKGDYDKRLSIQKLYYENYYGYGYFEGENAAQTLSYVKSGVLDQMVYDKVIYDKAKELKLAEDEDAITKEAKESLEEYMNSVTNKDDFKKAMDGYGLTEEDFLQVFKNNAVYKRVYDEITKDASVTDDEITKHYEENPYEYTEKPNNMNLSHILVKTNSEALAVKERLDGGESFEDVAKEVSTDTSTAQKGGQLGDVTYVNSGLIPTFVNAAIELKEGEISDPVKTTYGFHIIKCNSKTEYPEKPLEDVKDSIKEELLSEKKGETFDAAYKEWEDAAKVKKYTKHI